MSKRIPTVGFALILIFLLCREIDLSICDLGRHITNGEWTLSNSLVLFKNFYSYTHPEFPFSNHHWGSGFLFYWIDQALGLVGVQFLFVSLLLGAFYLVFHDSVFQFGILPSTLGALWMLPLLTQRNEVRPEGFSLLFSAIFYVVLSRFKKVGKQKLLLWLPLIMIFWVNIHVCFIFGFVLLGAFGLESFLHKDQKDRRVWLCLATLLCVFATLITPMGYRLALVPFVGFLDYGYRIAENQTIPFLIGLNLWGLVVPFGIAIALFVLLLVEPLFQKPRSAHGARWFNRIPPVSISLPFLTFLVLDSTAVRNHPFLGLFSIPFVAALAKDRSQRVFKFLLPLGALVVVSWLVVISFYSARSFGLGVIEKNDASARFFKDQQLIGPIFNNYDIGSYLIYHLFPKERVFIDNRPEAYPAPFLKDVYVPMQVDDRVWKEVEKKYEFNIIYFGWHDYTPAAQDFLRKRLSDPEWVPIYIDSFALIMIRNLPKNQAIISKFQVPSEVFRFNP